MTPNTEQDIEELRDKIWRIQAEPASAYRDNRERISCQTETLVQLFLAWQLQASKAAEQAVIEALKRIMASRQTHSQVTNGHIHVKNVDHEYWKITGRSLL